MLDMLMRALAHVLVPLFFLGMTGATIVVAITFVHDLVDFFEDDPVTLSASDKAPAN